MNREVEPADLSVVSDLLAGGVRRALGRDWSVRAGALDWSVESTLEHVIASLGKYALYLGSRATRYIPLRLDRMAGEVTQEDWLAALEACVRAFRTAAEAAPAGARAFHARGLADVEGYTALACAHVLEHGHDIARGLGFDFDPPEDICASVTRRLYPRLAPAIEGEAPWPAFLHVAGRLVLPGHPPVAADEPAFVAPLAEWDG
ncbi:MAG TPA: hypothetical protein VIC57_10530 [Candidatus Dormibacteraeota bacterium]